MKKKYEIIKGDHINYDGHTLYRIRALKDFTAIISCGVSKYELGGYIESEDNLSQEDNSWVYYPAKVYGNSSINGSVEIESGAVIKDTTIEGIDIRISDAAKITDSSIKSNNTIIYNATISHARIVGNIIRICDGPIIQYCVINGIYIYITENAIVKHTSIFSHYHIAKNALVKSENDILIIGPIGCRGGMTTFYNTKHGIYVCCGCFNGSINNFIMAVKKTHKDDEFYRETYLAAARFVKEYFKQSKAKNKKLEEILAPQEVQDAKEI